MLSNHDTTVQRDERFVIICLDERTALKKTARKKGGFGKRIKTIPGTE